MASSIAQQEFQQRCRSIKGISSRSKNSGRGSASYSFDGNGFATSSKRVTITTPTACFSQEFQGARTGKVKRFKNGVEVK
jgi:hypothetical protein